MRYFIIDKYSFSIKEVYDNSWFSNPIKKEGRLNDLMCKLETVGGYHAKYSWASDCHYYVDFYTRGLNAPFTLNGWRFPEEINRAQESSSRDGRIFNKFSFKCYMPNGQALNVGVQVDKPFIWGIMKAIKALVEMKSSDFNTCSYIQDGERHILLNSYYKRSNTCREYYI